MKECAKNGNTVAACIGVVKVNVKRSGIRMDGQSEICFPAERGISLLAMTFFGRLYLKGHH